MPYISSVQGQSYRVAISKEGESIQASLDGQTSTLDWQQLMRNQTGGHYSLLLAGRSYDIYARNITKAGEKSKQTYEILLEGERFEVTVEDERTRLLSAANPTTSSSAQIEAPMPGLVIGLPLEVGTQVNAGETVVVLEAMKMENDLTAPISGILKEIRISKGQTVDQGELLVVIAAAEES